MELLIKDLSDLDRAAKDFLEKIGEKLSGGLFCAYGCGKDHLYYCHL